MRSVRLVASLLCAVSGLAMSIPIANAQKNATFDVPNGVDTSPTAISPSGRIVGFYGDTTLGRVRGFLRDANGAITTFDAPIDNPQNPGMYSTSPTDLTQSGDIIGYSSTGDQVDVQPGFLRDRKGNLTYISPPFAWNTFPSAINSQGIIVGYYYDLIGYSFPFLRNPDGTFSSFDQTPIGQTFGAIFDINAAGQSTGYYFDFNVGQQLGFLRQPDGTITTFGILNGTDIVPIAINPGGAITGNYLHDDGTFHWHAFVRNADGTITTFDVLNASDTFPVAIDAKGQIVGYYTDANNVQHGFSRDTAGMISTFDVPDATSTVPTAMNAQGTITGSFKDSNGAQHGFVMRLSTISK